MDKAFNKPNIAEGAGAGWISGWGDWGMEGGG